MSVDNQPLIKLSEISDNGQSADESAEHAAFEALAELNRKVELLRVDVQELTRSVEALRATSSDRGPGRVLGILPEWSRGATQSIKSTIVTGRERREWAPPRPRVADAIVLLLLVTAALLVRAMNLSTAPPGLHGDEAATGIEARQILDSGGIGVYTGMAGGNPTGFYYLATIPVSLIDDPVVAVRFLSAITGTLGVVALFLLMRRNLGLGSAIAGSVLLLFSEWHISFSRTGFVTGTWPTVVLFGTITLMEAIRTRATYWWVLAGACLAAGTYIYNGNGPILILIAGFAVWTLFGWAGVVVCAAVACTIVAPWPGVLALALPIVIFVVGRRLENGRAWVNLAGFTIGSLVVLWKLIEFVRDRPQDYFGRGENLSILKSDAWRNQDSLADKVAFLASRYIDFWERLSFNPIPDGVDLTGVTPLVPKVTLAIVLVGMAVALVRRPTMLVIFSATIVVTAPLTSVMTDLTMRRALVIMPFLALLGGVGMIEVVRLALARGRLIGALAGAGLLILLGWSSVRNYTDFFDTTVASGPVRHTFGVNLRLTAEYLDTLPPDTYIYFYCDRWILQYDVVRLLAPDVRGENRLPKWGGDDSYSIDRSKGRPVFVFMENQVERLDAVRRLYPDGKVVTGPDVAAPVNGPAYVAYVPGDSSP